jgi:excisionase family DNA binding protein
MSQGPLFITVREAAARLRVAPADIVRLAREGKIRSRIEAFQRLVYLEDIIRLEANWSNIVKHTHRAPRVSRTPAPCRKAPRTPKPRLPRSQRHRPRPDWLTLAEAAALLKMSPATTCRYIYQCLLQAQKVRGCWYIPKQSVSDFTTIYTKWYTSRDAARLLRVTRNTVFTWIKSGDLEAYRIRQGYRINPESVHRILEQRARCITTTEAANRMCVTEATVRYFIAIGKLKARMFRERFYIDRDSFERFIAEYGDVRAERERALREGWLPLSTIARMLGYRADSLRRKVKRGQLPARRIGYFWYLAPEAVERLQQRLKQGNGTES